MGGSPSRPRQEPVTISAPPPQAPVPRPEPPPPVYRRSQEEATKYTRSLFFTYDVDLDNAETAARAEIGDAPDRISRDLYSGTIEDIDARTQVSNVARKIREADAEALRIKREKEAEERRLKLDADSQASAEAKAVQEATAEAVRRRSRARGQRSTVLASKLFSTESTTQLQETLGS